MIFSNPRAARLAAWTAMAGLVAGAVLGTCLARRAPVRSALALDPASVRYRYTTTPVDAAADTASTIAALEARLAAQPSPFDASELAELYLRRAREDGDAQGFAAAEAMARRSL